MTTQLYAQPYDISATGFYFTDAEDYAAKAKVLRNDHGQRVEELEIQLIEGEAIDAALAHACGLHQGDIGAFFEKIEEWDDHEKQVVIIAVGECSYAFDWAKSEPGDFEVELYTGMTLRELAEQFVQDGLYGEISRELECYLDYTALEGLLDFDYTETEIAGTRLIYRCA